MGDEKAAPKAGATADPVVLRMELHCAGCAQKVKKSIKHLAGVESVAADVATNTVVVAGTADAAALKARIEAKTKKPVEVVSAGGGGAAAKKPAAEPKAVKDDGGEKKDAQAKEEKGKKQPPEEKKPKEETVLLRIRLHCDGCADRIRRRIYKIKGVKEVVMDGNAKDEVKVSGTMDVPAMLTYLTEKLNRAVEAVAPGSKKDEKKKDKGGDADGGEKKKDAAGGDKKDKGKSIEIAGPSTAAAAASMAPAPAEASTYHVSPYGHGYFAYPQQQGPPPQLLPVLRRRQWRRRGLRQPQCRRRRRRRLRLLPPPPQRRPQLPAAAVVPAVPVPARHVAGAAAVQRREPQRLLGDVIAMSPATELRGQSDDMYIPTEDFRLRRSEASTKRVVMLSINFCPNLPLLL
uniref:HMA domain-containing protein n=1 Tax=Oryza glaberrima TaxID=4538 RepID=I1P7N3_ORYGL